ncbi:MAG: sugar-binding domain-containing protein, partial [Sphingobacteriaceae bacterium]
MQIRGLIAILFITCALNSFGQGIKRNIMSLNGEWTFLTDAKETGLSSGWNESLPQSAEIVKVPHTWNLMEGLERYHGLAWYQKKITVPANWKNKNIQIKFGAVYHDAVVYLNGKKITEHLNSGYTTFYANIANNVKFGTENTLVVSVSNKFSETNLPYKDVFDWVNDGGIIRDIDLIASGKPSIRYAHVIPVINFKDTSAKAQIKIRLWEGEVKKSKFHISINEKKSGKKVFAKDVTLTKSGNEFITSIDLKKVNLWRFDNPFLYQIEVSTSADKLVSQFGFRKIELQGKKLMVNNEAVRLPGIEYMPASHPDYGSAEPKWVMDSVMTMFKDLNATITRFHWQVDEHMLNLMDEKGILLQAEIPWWQQPANL